MLAPRLAIRIDGHSVNLGVSGPLTTNDHVAALTTVCEHLPDGAGLVVNLSAVTVLSESGARGLRAIASTLTAAGTPVAFVCSDLLMRAELELADLDQVAPLMIADEEALALVDRAA